MVLRQSTFYTHSLETKGSYVIFSAEGDRNDIYRMTANMQSEQTDSKTCQLTVSEGNYTCITTGINLKGQPETPYIGASKKSED